MQNESVAILAFIALAMLALSLACMFVEMRNEEKRKLKHRRAFAAPHFTHNEPREFEAQRKRDALRRFQAQLDRR
jgi:hypothetical protein